MTDAWSLRVGEAKWGRSSEERNAATTSPGEDSGAQDSARPTPPRRPPCVPQQWGTGLGGQARHAESQAGKRPSRAELRPRLVTRFWSVSQATSSHASLAKASHAAEPGAVGIYRVISQEADSDGA